MTHNEYFSISVQRGSHNKKGSIHVLSAFVPLSCVTHDTEKKMYSISRSDLVKHMDYEKLQLFTKLIGKFSKFSEFT